MSAVKKLRRMTAALSWDAGLEDRPSGPTNEAELRNWPAQLVKDLCQRVKHRRTLADNLSRGLLLGSDYAGSRNADDSLERMLGALSSPLNLPASAILITAYTCDSAEAPMKVCLDGLRPAVHHFSDLSDRLPPGLADEVQALLLNAGESKTKAFADIGKLLLSSYEDVCPLGVMTCKCVRHYGRRCSCSLNPADYDMSGGLSLNIAGVTCVAWTPLGGNARHAHPSMKDLHIWAASTRAMSPDLIVVECAAIFDRSILLWWFEDMYVLQFYDHPGPILFGHPMKRARMYCVLSHRSRFVVTGTWEDYLRTFARATCLDGDAYFNAESSDVLYEAKVLASVRGMAMPTTVADLDFLQFYPVGQKERFKQYSDVRPPGATFIADLQQNIGCGPSPGCLLPTLVTHGSLHSWKKRRCLTPEEHLAAQGVQVKPVPGSNVPSLMSDLIRQRLLSRAEMKRLAGNAMHQATVASIVLYSLATLKRRASVSSLLFFCLPAEGCDEDQDNQDTALCPPRRMGSLLSDGSQQDELS